MLPNSTIPQTKRTFTATTFTKAMDVRPFFNIYGVDTSKKWPHERIWNEVAALKLIPEKTTIPVPQVLDWGYNTDGAYLTVQRVDGIELTTVKNRCRQAQKDGYTGLNGVVIPSPWVTEYDRRENWASKTSEEESYVFCHGDLGPQNLMCGPVTLEIVWVVDWENAGYLEEEFLHLWAVEGNNYYGLYDYNDQLARQIALLEGQGVQSGDVGWRSGQIV
ncbi:uncharacterized protein MKZ38_010656 [Zalerion maritima]|uniref:Aminoglycoside phosphotransferase domain-containing protein n=1 Tax=Zalerion maritima TaxID=339359 RepID=A0AAD5RTQ0_9PEZI|nr:uncharacterized protein MKZ38_010656 [Zalerion maritima]